MLSRKLARVISLILLSAFVSGCSLTCTQPTIWRTISSPDVTNFWDIREHGESWEGLSSFGVGGIGGADSMYNEFQVSVGYEIPWNNWVQTGTRAGILFAEQDVTVKMLRIQRYGLISALQVHCGYNFLTPYMVGDGSVIVGKVLRPYTIGDEVPQPKSVLYIGYRRGWLWEDNQNGPKSKDAFSSAFAGLELWLSDLGIYFSFERLKPVHPKRDCWLDRENEDFYILVASGFKALFRE